MTGLTSSNVTKFHMKESLLSLSHDDFLITDKDTNQEAFRIVRKLTSIIRQSKSLYDASGNLIWTMQHPLFKMFHRVYKFEDSNGRLLFKIRNHHRFIPGQGKKLSLRSVDGSVTMSSKGKWLDLTTPIVGSDGRRIVAEITKKLISARSVVTGLSGYDVTIQPQTDIPTIFAFVAVLDEERERNT